MLIWLKERKGDKVHIEIKRSMFFEEYGFLISIIDEKLNMVWIWGHIKYNSDSTTFWVVDMQNVIIAKLESDSITKWEE